MNAAEQRVGDWMSMASGRVFWPLDPRADEVHIDDIAQALSNVCRFGGRCSEYYSVAQHSVWVARYVERSWPVLPHVALLAMHALLHDTAEAYLGDVVRPLKPAMVVQRVLGDGKNSPLVFRQEEFCVTEQRVLLAIYEHLRMPFPSVADESKVKHADNVALATEARDLMGDPRWPELPEPVREHLDFLSPRAARTQFLREFERLTNAMGALRA
jgi:hypothetical protein